MVKYKEEFDGIKIYAWCLLLNHFHMLIKSDKSGLEISSYMRKIQQAYAMYFKTKYRKLSPDLNLLKFPQMFE
jgi:REP element-mobilizing transposase RayT